MTDKRPWTRGPWRRNNRAAFTVEAGDRTICSAGAYSDGTDATHEENHANACLIAAAPALYEALEEAQTAVVAFQQICSMQGVHRVADDMKILADRINAALRAANPDGFESEGE